MSTARKATADSAWIEAPDRLEAIATEVHVWRADLDGAPAPGATALSAAERQRAERLLADRKRQRWIAARVALRRILGRYLGEDPAAIELEAGPRGKPALAERPVRLRFNITHSGDLALVAVTAEREVGIDLEREDERRDFVRLAEVGLEPEPAAMVRAAPEAERTAVFYAAWVRHEATVKCLGSGLGAAAPGLPVSVRDLDLDPGYAAALAVSGTEPLSLRRYLLA